MRKASLFLIVLITMSCSKDEENGSLSSTSIYGKWYNKEIVINDVVFPYDDHEVCGKDYIEFYDQNKIRSIDIWGCEEDVNWIGTFSKSDNNLTISNGIGNKTVEIIELNSSSLAYKYEGDENNDGISEHCIEKFTRQ